MCSREEILRLLAGCYENSLKIAHENHISEIAFPCIGTGIHGWPTDLAAGVAFETVATLLDERGGFSRVVFCCFGAADRDRYAKLIGAAR
jgi:O-acetyl-ADP-ribose deacetylase